MVGSGKHEHILNLPDIEQVATAIGDEGISQLIAEADEIVAGQVRLFGDNPVPMVITPPGELTHWTDYEVGRKRAGEQGGIKDIKFIWEPARFGWAFTLARAYYLTEDERYSETFWQYFENFQNTNPQNMGPNWISAQEVALRVIAFVFSVQVFSKSTHSTARRATQLASAIAQHAARTPLTLIYARAQNNNHLLSEAAGMITASLALPDHPEATRWSKLGWKWFNRGLETQIAADGSYMQHSTNYHRLMLQLSLWVWALQEGKASFDGKLGKRATYNLKLATQWLLSLTDSDSGRTPNLGPNDGANILPLSPLPFEDYRPVLQAASKAFLDRPAFEPGPWDEMGLWFGSSSHDTKVNVKQSIALSTLQARRSWAYLRAARFSDRPGHADQLHLDLWWRGLNVAQDAGTYHYNAEPPWENALTHTAVHNTILVDGRQQMTRAGRFLYLDWAQAEIMDHEHSRDGAWEKIIAQHNGYRRLGVIHQRAVTAHQADCWIVEDQLLPTPRSRHSASRGIRLHWLLPDWEWKIDDTGLKIDLLSPYGWVNLTVWSTIRNLQSSVVRAGEILHGDLPADPTWGWVSPTYGVNIPALSYSVSVEGSIPLTISTEWSFPSDE